MLVCPFEAQGKCRHGNSFFVVVPDEKEVGVCQHLNDIWQTIEATAFKLTHKIWPLSRFESLTLKSRFKPSSRGSLSIHIDKTDTKYICMMCTVYYPSTNSCWLERLWIAQPIRQLTGPIFIKLTSPTRLLNYNDYWKTGPETIGCFRGTVHTR